MYLSLRRRSGQVIGQFWRSKNNINQLKHIDIVSEIFLGQGKWMLEFGWSDWGSRDKGGVLWYLGRCIKLPWLNFLPRGLWDTHTRCLLRSAECREASGSVSVWAARQRLLSLWANVNSGPLKEELSSINSHTQTSVHQIPPQQSCELSVSLFFCVSVHLPLALPSLGLSLLPLCITPLLPCLCPRSNRDSVQTH